MHAATSPEGTVRLATALVLPEPALEVANSSMPTCTTFSKVIQDSGRPPAEGKNPHWRKVLHIDVLLDLT